MLVAFLSCQTVQNGAILYRKLIRMYVHSKVFPPMRAKLICDNKALALVSFAWGSTRDNNNAKHSRKRTWPLPNDAIAETSVPTSDNLPTDFICSSTIQLHWGKAKSNVQANLICCLILLTKHIFLLPDFASNIYLLLDFANKIYISVAWFC